MNTTSVERMTAERFQKAAAFLPQHVAPKLSGMVHGGYWIDDHRFFFCVSDVVEGIQRRVPSIANSTSGQVGPVLPIEALVDLIAARFGKPVSVADLASADYEMPDARTLVVMLGLDVFQVDLRGPTLVWASKLEPVMQLRSPDGLYACVLDGHDVAVKELASGATRRLTIDGEAWYAYGAMPESGPQPIATSRGRMPAGMWSRDSQWFVTHRIDERHLPEGGLVEHAPADGGRPVLHRYKIAGPDVEPPRAEFIAFHLASGRTVRTGELRVLTQAFSPFMYRQCWVANDELWFFDWDRYSSSVSLMALNLASGVVKTVLTETTESGWIDLHPFMVGQPMVRPLEATGELIWYSEADGRGHLYLHDLATGACKSRITDGPWVVRELIHVDEARRRILFLASGFEEDSDPAHRRLCAVDFDGSGFETIFAADGDLLVKPDPISGVDQYRPFRPSYASSGVSGDGRHVAACLGSADIPTRWVLIDLESGRQIEMACVDIDALWHAPKPRRFEALAADGKTKLFGAMVVPSDFDPSKSYPLVDYIYPGPQINWFMRRFPNANVLTLQAIAELGMVGIVLETRGMPSRDRAFHQDGRGRLLEPQLGDHVAVIEQLCQRHAFLDRHRVGICGQSGGGHATARALFDYPEIFKVGVAVCGNHDARNYLAHWLDKYGGRPGTPERDEQANAFAAHKLQGKLLLMHGDLDDNVHPGHTLALSAALIAAGKEFDQLIVPGATHGVLLESPYAMQRLWAYLVRHLLGVEPPKDFKLAWSLSGTAAAMLMQMGDIA